MLEVDDELMDLLLVGKTLQTKGKDPQVTTEGKRCGGTTTA